MAVEPFWYHFWTFNIFELFEGFYCWNHCFFHHFFWKNHQVSEGRRRLFHQEIFDPFSVGEIALKFPKFENSWFAHNSLNNGRRAVLIPFLDFQYFWTFWGFLLLKSLFFMFLILKSLFFDIIFFLNHQVSEGVSRLLRKKKYLASFPGGNRS